MTRRFKVVDILYIIMMILPVCLGIAIKVVTTPPSEGITITGARIFFEIPMPIQNLSVTESQVNSAIVIISVLFLCLYLTHGIKNGVWLKRHHLAELIVEKSTSMVVGNMGEYFKGFAPLTTP